MKNFLIVVFTLFLSACTINVNPPIDENFTEVTESPTIIVEAPIVDLGQLEFPEPEMITKYITTVKMCDMPSLEKMFQVKPVDYEKFASTKDNAGYASALHAYNNEMSTIVANLELEYKECKASIK